MKFKGESFAAKSRTIKVHVGNGTDASIDVREVRMSDHDLANAIFLPPPMATLNRTRKDGVVQEIANPSDPRYVQQSEQAEERKMMFLCGLAIMDTPGLEFEAGPVPAPMDYREAERLRPWAEKIAVEVMRDFPASAITEIGEAFAGVMGISTSEVEAAKDGFPGESQEPAPMDVVGLQGSGGDEPEPGSD